VTGGGTEALERIAAALERLAPPPPPATDFFAADGFLWHPAKARLAPVPVISRLDVSLLQGVDRQKDLLLANTRRFARGFPANNALLWGARGMGKSSLVKAVHAAVNAESPRALALVEIHREDIATLPDLLALIRAAGRRFLLFCDDLSFDGQDAQYKSLKAVLEGGLEGRPETVLFYATSNRRHLLAREMIENEQSTAINPGEAVDEKVSLSDRFGLWLGFYHCDQATYLAMVEAYARYFGLYLPADQLRTEALDWAMTRGSRSGRVAWQFTQDLAGRLERRLERPA